MNNQRGTSSYYSENSLTKWFKKENLITRISFADKGQKITARRGTKTMWVSKKPNPAIPLYQKVLILNRGTRRLDIKQKFKEINLNTLNI